MPTGYTCYIEDGEITTAKEFLTICARAFGACIEMKDDSLNKPIPEEFMPSTYHQKALEQAKVELAQYQSYSLLDVQKELDESYEKRIKDYTEIIAKEKEKENRYIKVLDELKLWQPPTEEHINLKNFAIDQINISIPQCDISYWQNKMDVPKQSAQEWLDDRIDDCNKDIEYHTREWNEEQIRVAGRNQWIKDLRASL